MMDYEQLLKEFRETVTAAISTGNLQVNQKLDNVLNRLGELEKSIVSLDNHRNSASEKIVALNAKNAELESRVKEIEKDILIIKTQGQGISKITTALWTILSALLTGLMMNYIIKK